jgi:hypothetical protein
MSFIKLQPENFDTFSLTLRPRYEFNSSSLGVTGSVPLVERPASVDRTEISLQRRTLYGTSSFSEVAIDLQPSVNLIQSLSSTSTSDASVLRTKAADKYLDLSTSLLENRRNNIAIPVRRLVQDVEYTSASLIKSMIRRSLMSERRSVYTDSNYSYKNYHSINFFTASSVPSDSALIYPNRTKDNTDNKKFTLKDQFSVDFYINPRYMAEPGTAFNPGTILHISSSICVSLLAGSHINQNNQNDTFRIAVGINKSANVPPNLIDLSIPNGSRTGSQEYLYVSDDNVLKHNNWHHVTIRWGRSATSKTGSIVVDDTTTSFIYSNDAISSVGTDDVTILGNFCNMPTGQTTKKFFNSSVGYTDGVFFINGAGSVDPTGFTFDNPLNAELHDFKIFARAISNAEIEKFRSTGPSLSTKNLVFYVPGLFINTSILAQDDFISPVSKSRFTPITPFNINLAHATQVFSPNLQNFLCDVTRDGIGGARGNIVAPRLYKLNSPIPTGLEDTASDFMFRRPEFIKRVYTILPNDNGLFLPNYEWLPRQASGDYKPYRDDLGSDDLTAISLNGTDLNTPITTQMGEATVDLFELSYNILTNTNIRTLKFPRPNNYNIDLTLQSNKNIKDAGNITTLLSFSGSINSRTGGFKSKGLFANTADNSSNLLNLYTYSNLYYGNQIFPGSLTLSSEGLTGSAGTINIKLRDNGAGGLYRDDCDTPAATWASVGNIFYDQGIVLLKTPHLYYFGKNNFSTEFNGTQNIHVYSIDAISPAGEINSSSNPSYISFPPTNEQNETAQNFVYITGINIHDDNFNVIMRANLAQPVLKRPDEEFLFRLKYDF